MNNREAWAAGIMVVVAAIIATPLVYWYVLHRVKRRGVFMSSKARSAHPHWILTIEARLDAAERRLGRWVWRLRPRRGGVRRRR